MRAKDPIVKVSDALKKTDGNQSELARQLGVRRAWMCEIVSEKTHLPPLLAHRFISIYGRKAANGFELVNRSD